MLESVTQPTIVKEMGYDGELDGFLYRIKYNKILNLSGKGQSILEAVPNSAAEDETIVVEFKECYASLRGFLLMAFCRNHSLAIWLKDLSQSLNFITDMFILSTLLVSNHAGTG